MLFEEPTANSGTVVYEVFSAFNIQCACVFGDQWRVYWYYIARPRSSSGILASDFVAKLETPGSSCGCMIPLVF